METHVPIWSGLAIGVLDHFNYILGVDGRVAEGWCGELWEFFGGLDQVDVVAHRAEFGELCIGED